ncbi:MULTISPECIES: GIN domain-containing protein [unclassified Fusibacter]|uniref:GIN domain-containing protein n=1 Tax=unclassified Fusibacter TaxID=2624464 RepID=UPI0010132D3E|nr:MULTISPECIES: DUF2807 domain-containing protein [unclassified Fusibacter]MCK8060654.1 DUF2807 domain-containing protein [Fusibacter sp. A2]NPE22892.1 hypothetical protein [Fusibacter sp. A1]RXV59960.1 hypothetical protein DWB64_13685 [Fusibacter sp. A1]
MKNNQFSQERINEVLGQIGSAINQVVKGVTEAVTGSGNLISEEIEVGAFTGVHVKGMFEVTIKEGEYGLVVTADDNLIPKLKIDTKGSVLVLDLEPTVSLLKTTLKAEITVPALDYLKVSGISNVHIEPVRCQTPMQLIVGGASQFYGPIESESLELTVTGTAKAKVVVKASELDVDVSGTANLKMKGEAKHARISTSGTSNTKADKLLLEDLVVRSDGTSVCLVTVNGNVKAKASGTAVITLAGDATVVERNVSGLAVIKKAE